MPKVDPDELALLEAPAERLDLTCRLLSGIMEGSQSGWKNPNTYKAG